jgi:cyclic-di-AMP phosphodiesterase PgpH
MWLRRQQTSRQKEIRKGKAERGLTIAQRFLHPVPLGPAGVTVLVAGVAAIILNVGGEVFDLRVGQVAPRAIAARLKFEVADPTQTQVLREREEKSAPSYYRLDKTLLDDIRGRFTNVLALAKTYSAEPEKLRALAAERLIVLDDDSLREMQRIAAESESTEFQSTLETAMNRLALEPLVETSESAQRSLAVDAVLLDAPLQAERRVRVPQLLQSSDFDSAERVAEDIAKVFPSRLRRMAEMSLAQILRPTPNAPAKPLYRYDSGRSVDAAKAARDAVRVQFSTYAAGTMLADVGPLTPEEVELLRAEHTAYQNHIDDNFERRRERTYQVTGRTFLAFLITIGLAGYIALYQRRSIAVTARQLITIGALLLLLATARFAFVQTGNAYLAFGPVGLAAALLALGYKRGSIFAVCGTFAVFATLAVQQSIGFFLVMLAVSATLLFGLGDVRRRGRIVLVGGLAALVAFGTTLAIGLIDSQTLRFILLHQALWAAGMTLLAAFIVEGVLPGVERLFGFSTSMTLLEWCDPSKPLLRMLAAEAPGTYNHSLLVGALAEAASEAIGANGLLSRAGAYYHDIGKINKPEYFVENQVNGVSRHERLAPQMSLLIIVNHVKDGVEMAREYGLPAQIRPFIAQHHGTTVVEYFYHVANKLRKPGEPEVSQTEYRYQGPKPQTREIAIVMICDAVEGAVRSMSEPTPARIEDTVEKIVHRRLMDGQFDECDLTLRDLQIIEKSVIKSLNGIYHARIKYPEEQAEPEPVETRSA